MANKLSPASAQSRRKVMVVDCDQEIIHILEVNLAHANLEVISARTGAQALSKAAAQKPDVVLLEAALPDLEGLEICRRLRELEKTSHVPIIIMGAESDRKSLKAQGFVAGDLHIAKPFDPKEVVAIVKAQLKRIERGQNSNPLTGLPGQMQVSERITSLIEQRKTFAAIYIAMDDFRAFNRAYGYLQGDRSIRLLADIVSEAVLLFGNPDDLAGHLDADNFVVVSTPGKATVICRRIIADFNERIKALYADEHQQKGYVAYENPSGGEEQSPTMSLRVAVITNQSRTFSHYLEVSEAAAEQLEHLRRYPRGEYYSGADDAELSLAIARRGATYVYREQLDAMRGVLGWLNFVVSELNGPITGMKDCLGLVESLGVGNLSPEQKNSLKAMWENVNRLGRVVEGLTHLTKTEWVTSAAVFEEVDVGNTFRWIMEQVRELAEQQRVEIDIKGVEDIGQLAMDKRNLTQGLLYLVRSAVQASPPGSKLHIRAAEMSEESIGIEITNHEQHIAPPVIPPREQSGMEQGAPSNELYPAALLVQGLGGKLSITSEEAKGVTYKVTLPRKWQSSVQEVNALQLAMDISRKEARAELKNVQRLLSSLVEQIPPVMKDSVERLNGKVQELSALCNRSLFLANDVTSRLEAQQDQLLRQEAERLATSETTLTICREVARSMHMEYIFDLTRAKRVAKYALTIANEFALSESDRLALYHAALLKDLALVLSPYDMIGPVAALTMEEAKAARARFTPVWKALLEIPFLSSALEFIGYRYERYDGTGNRFGAKGANIPLGARILAVADTLDSMMSGPPPQGKLTAGQAMPKIADESGLRFDPDVVNALMRTRTIKELSD